MPTVLSEPRRVVRVDDRQSGLHAFIVLDDVTLGPAAGGVRTRHYADDAAALADARELARAMTIKCALAGLAAGGGKAVVIDHPGLDRPRAFEALGRRIEALAGLFRTAGDLGTSAADLEAMGRATKYVHSDEGNLAQAVGRGVLRCIEACAELAGRRLGDLRVAIQGAGAIGAAVARTLVAAGARITVTDLDGARADSLAAELGARAVLPAELISTECDVLAPCAIGRVITPEVAKTIRAWAVCGAANNILEPDADEVLRARGILHVPDAIASAGAVIDGIGKTVMGLADRAPLIDQLGKTARTVLDRAAHEDRTPTAIAHQLAEARISAAR